jgi:hypothetical protein
MEYVLAWLNWLIWRIPIIATGKALRFVHAEDRATFRAGPFGHFNLDKLIDAIFLDGVQILERVDAILAPIAFIQAFHKRTWKSVAFITVLESTFHQLITVLDPARQAGFHFLRIITPATGTVVLIPDISPAKTAIDPTGGDQDRID